MQVTLEIQTLIAIAGGLVGLVALLWQLLRASDMKRVANLERSVGDLVRAFSKIVRMEEKVDQLKRIDNLSQGLKKALVDVEQQCAELKRVGAVNEASIEHVEERVKSLTETVEKMREDLADARETIMGFSKDFVSRRELMEETRVFDQRRNQSL